MTGTGRETGQKKISTPEETLLCNPPVLLDLLKGVSWELELLVTTQKILLMIEFLRI